MSKSLQILTAVAVSLLPLGCDNSPKPEKDVEKEIKGELTISDPSLNPQQFFTALKHIAANPLNGSKDKFALSAPDARAYLTKLIAKTENKNEIFDEILKFENTKFLEPIIRIEQHRLRLYQNSTGNTYGDVSFLLIEPLRKSLLSLDEPQFEDAVNGLIEKRYLSPDTGTLYVSIRTARQVEGISHVANTLKDKPAPELEARGK